MARRVLLSYLLVMVVTALVFSVNIRPAAADNLERPLARLPQSLAVYYSGQGGWQSVQPALQEASLLTGQELTLTDRQGQIVAATRPELIGQPVSQSARALPIRAGQDQSLVGQLYISGPAANLTTDNNPADNWPGWVFGGLVALLVTLGTSWSLTRSLNRPLAEMNQLARQLAQGDYSVRLQEAGYGRNEFGRLAQAFNSLAEGLGRLEKWRRSNLAEVTHDLKSPLTVMAGYLEGLRSNQIADRRSADRAFAAMHTEVERMLEMVNSLRQSVPLKRGPVNVPGLVDEVLDRLAPLAERSGVTLSRQLELISSVYQLDRLRLGQALYNLVENSLRHTPPGGRIEVTAGQKGNNLWLKVCDNGSGIAPADLPHIFEVGYRAGLTPGSAGLGLAIVKAAVEAHGGTVAVESGLEGTVFTLQVPAQSLANL